MAKYKAAKPNDNAVSEQKIQKPVSKQKKNHFMRLIAIIFAGIMLLSLAVLFPFQTTL
jgi:multisubunit Na+/H+ antiporter MnhB subunit